MPANCIGLDIGSSSIKILQVKRTSKGIRLLDFGIEPLPAQTIVDGSIMDQSSVVEAIRKLKTTLGIRNKRVATAISGHSVIIKKIQLPQMTADELSQQLPFEAEQHIPFRKDEVEIDHQVLSNKNASGQIDLLLVAAKKEVIADYTQVIREAKLIPTVMDVTAFTVQNAFEANYDANPGESVGLINVGAAISNVNVVCDGTSVFTRDVTVGGGAFTDEIQKRASIGYDEAEGMKISFCEAAPGSAGVPPTVEAVINEVAEGMAGKLQRTIDFYLAATADASLSRIFLAGGSARVPALLRALQEKARIPVEILDPFRRLLIDETKFDMDFIRAHAAEATVGLGLALRRPGDHG
ncbi:MAG TPA: type IV pilus assembly protein PilM [Polyangia bacterium]|jgi:type IV pilus assembly protein PilM|nr:type IV pilus assembly protein PilM [Polyangia bacterium]